MQSFRPFRSTLYRHQKYYSEKRPSLSSKGSVFNLPRQVIGQTTLHTFNNEIPKILPEPPHKFAVDYQSNLKKTVKKHSIQMLNKKAFSKIAYSFIEMGASNPQIPAQTIIRRKPSQVYSNKNIAFNTLSILYQTIIQTKVKRKQKEAFQLSAKKLPILEKTSKTPLSERKLGEILVKNSLFDKYKLNLTTINSESQRSGLEKYEKVEQKFQHNRSFKTTQNSKGYFLARKKRLQHQSKQRSLDQIVPWNQLQVQNEVELQQN